MRVPAPRLFASLVPQVLALLLAACGGGDDSGGTPSPAPFDTTAPTVPAGVTAVAQSGTQVLVSWTASTDAGAGVAGYRVYRDGAATPVATVATLNYTDSNLTAGTNYSYTVRAFDAAVPPNESALSGAVFVNTPIVPIVDTTPPTVPTNLAATALSPTDVRLTWTASTDAGTGVAGYRLFRNGGATPVATITSGTTFTDTGLTANTAYTYTLRAFDAATPANESALTAGVAVTTLAVPDTTAPTVPAGLTATALSSTQIRLNWSASTDAGAGVAGYRIFRNGSTTALTSVTGTTFTDSGLTASTAYMYAVAAYDAATPANVSAMTAQVTATTLATPDTTAPTVPTGVTATALSSTQIRINWSPSTDAGTGVAGYRIFRDGSATVLATVTSGTTYTDSGLTASTSYSYTLRAFDAATPTANVSALSTAATATTQALPDTTAPTVPGGVMATALSTTQIRIDWTASTDAGTGVAGYRIYRNGSTTALTTVTLGTTFTDSGLTANTTYSYTVLAFDAATPANVSALSSAASATTLMVADTTPPTTPAGLAATVLSSTSIRLNWTASTDAGAGLAGYLVFNNGSGGGTAIATVTSGTTYTVTGLTPSTAYTYSVRAFDAVVPTPNISAASNSATATTQAAADTTAPTVPTGVTATTLSASQIRIDWTASTDAGAGVAGYRIFRNGSTTVLATVTSGTTYTDSGLAANTMYSYTLRAFDAATPANVSGLSASASATTQAAQNPSSGLDTRPSNTSCVAGAPPSQSASYTFQQVFPSLSFSTPIAIMQAPGNNAVWYVVQQGGTVKKFNNVTSPATPTNFISITVTGGNDERGLLGMAFHPNYPTDPRVYLYYTSTDATLGAVDRLSEFRTTDGGATLNPATENILFNVDDPETNHNGGNIVFGPDGYLYIGIGDGGGGDDQHGTNGNGQRLTILLAKMLRIDVGPLNALPQPYSIPAGNPYAANPRCNVSGTSTTTNCPEIYAYGFRNPWRWSFDRSTGDLWVGDVGESDWEEIDKVTLGGNYGWRCREGAHTHLSCGTTGPYIDPVAEIGHPDAEAIIGGYVYRGSAIPGLNGRYIFGDESQGFLWDIARDTTPTLQLTDADGLGTPAQITSFGEDQAGELYFLGYGGSVYKIVPGGGGGGGTVASVLSQTGCANATDPKLPASGMIPYAPNAPFWSDGAVKTRWLALPTGANINVGTDNDFDLPNGSVLRKDFTLNGVLAETRLFMHHTDGNWAGYTYQWNAMGTDATRVVGGLTTTIGGQTWEFPSESACLTCHTAAAGRTLGLEIGQLNGDLLYPVTGRTANQVYTLNFIDTLRPVITLPVDQLPVIPNPFGTAGTEDQRARAWLHSNCSNCHRPGGVSVNLDFRYTTSLLGTNACNVPPSNGDLGLSNPMLIAVGDASRSIVVARVNRVGTNAMPPLARHSIDTAGVALLTSWINNLTSCN